MRVGDIGDALNAGSPFTMLAEAWLEDLMLDVDRAHSTKDIYERELRGLVLPFFEHFTVREVTVGRIERFLREQRAKSANPSGTLTSPCTSPAPRSLGTPGPRNCLAQLRAMGRNRAERDADGKRQHVSERGDHVRAFPSRLTG